MNDQHDLRRVLGPVSATCVVVGAIVGVGIFFTPQRVAEIAGSGELALLTWTVGGLVALTGALTFAELGGLYPRTGGQYDILRDAYGAPVGFLYVFCNATAIQAGAIAIIAVISAQHLGVLVQGTTPSPGALTVLASAMIVGLTLANVAGVRWGATIQNITTFAKMATLLLITGLAAFASDGVSEPLTGEPAASQAAASAAHPVALVFAGLVPVLFSFGGWQQALWMGGEVREPGRNIPQAIVVGVLLVVAAYLCTNWGYLRLLGYPGVVASEALAAEAVSSVWPNIGGRFVAGAVAFSAFGVLNAQLLSGPRLLLGMARGGKFFAAFSRVHAQLRTPVAAIVLLGGMGLALLLAAGESGVNQILTGIVLVDSIFFLLTGLALILLRRTRSAAKRPVRVPLYPLVPLLFVAGEAAVIAGAFLDENYRKGAVIGVLWVAAAMVCYATFFRARE